MIQQRISLFHLFRKLHEIQSTLESILADQESFTDLAKSCNTELTQLHKLPRGISAMSAAADKVRSAKSKQQKLRKLADDVNSNLATLEALVEPECTQSLHKQCQGKDYK